MNTAAIYCRVSTKKQEKHGISLEAQEAKCRQYAKLEGLDVVFVGVEAESAKDTNRPVFKQIEQMIAKKQIQNIITVKQDRLSRDLEDSSRMVKLFVKKGITLHFPAEGGKVNLSDNSEEMLYNMKSVFSQSERRKISLNTRLTLSYKKDLGQRISGSAPYGYLFLDGIVVGNPVEQDVIARIHELHDSGLSIRKIIARLASEGCYNRSEHEFTVRAIHNIILAKAA